MASDDTIIDILRDVHDDAANALRVEGTISVGSSITANQGTPAATANAWPVKLTDGTDTADVTAASALKVDGSAVTQPVSGTVAVTQGTSPWVVDGSGVTQPVSGPLTDVQLRATAVPVSGPLTDTQLRATPVPVSGTVTANAGTGTFTVGQATGSNLHTVLDSGTLTSITNALPAGTNVIGHVIADSGSTTAVTGNVTVVQPTAANLNATIGNAAGASAVNIQDGGNSITVDGTVAATQSGTWNINNISGTISLPTGAATEATLAKLPLAQGSTTSGQSGPLVQAAVTTAAPSYTTAQTSPLSLTTVGALRVDGSATTQPISGTVTANAGSGTFTVSGTVTANQGGAPWSFNQTQVNGVAVSTGNGIAGTGVQRVTIASDNTAFSVNAVQSGTWTVTGAGGTFPVTDSGGSLTVDNGGTFAVQAAQSGTWTVQPGNTANTTAWLVTGTGGTFPVTGTVTTNSATSTSGGMLFFRNTALTNTATAIKASAGNFYYYHFYNTGTADAFVQFYDVAAGSVTVGTTPPSLTQVVPGNGGVLDGSFGGSPFSFATAITIAATSTATGGAAPGTTLLVNVGYK